jgi:hypothetical protein
MDGSSLCVITKKALQKRACNTEVETGRSNMRRVDALGEFNSVHEFND